MAFTAPLWAFALLPLFLLLAALFWGAPPISLVSELFGLITGKPFPARCGRQMSRLAVLGHGIFWLFVLSGAAFLIDHALWQSEFVTTNSLMLVLGAALPFFGTLCLIAYDLTWKGARENKTVHFLLGCLANVPIKYGYWFLVVLALLAFRNIPLESPLFVPVLRSPLWSFFCLWPVLSLGLAASLGMCYLVLRRNKDDWGRDYYRFAAPFLAKWHLLAAVATLAVMAWLFFSLKGIFNLYLPQIWYAALASAVSLALASVCSAAVIMAENPMRLKGLMILGLLFSYVQIGLLAVTILETLNRYVPGWSIPTFMPEVLLLLR